MPSAERETHDPRWVWRWPSRCTALLAVCLGSVVVAWPRPSEAQSPSAPSEREAERRRLLDQLGLKKRAAPVTPPSNGDDGQVEPKQDEEKKGEEKKASPEPSQGVVFSGSVQRVLLGACRACHSKDGSAGKSAYVLSGTLDADFAATRRQVNTAEPAQSPLLRRASGVAHAGGAVLEPGSAQYQQLLRWIGAGAKRGASGQTPAMTVVAGVAASPTTDAATAAGRAPPAAPPAMAPRGPPAPPTPVAAVSAQGAASVAGLAYAPTVHDALNQACSGCHRSGAAAGRTGFVLTGEVPADFASARRFVNLDQPEQSPLVRKASGVAHAGGAVLPLESAGYAHLLEWIRSGALGPADSLAEAAARAEPAPSAARADVSPDVHAAAPAVPAAPGEMAHGQSGLSLPFNFRLNGRFDLSYERRNFDTQPFSSGDNAIQSYHHFVFLSRQSAADPIGFTAELIDLTFWEVNYRLSLPQDAGKIWIKAGKLLVPFGPDAFHQSYGGLAGFDQRVLPLIWAREGMSARYLLERGDVSGSADVYAVRGHALAQREAVLNLQSDLSPLDSAHVAVGARLRASWQALSLFYSGYVNALGFGRVLYLQAADLEVWRLRGVPVLDRVAAELGLLRADISGAGSGQDYYHFASYLRLRYFLTDQVYVQYRQGLRTFDNRRGVFRDDTRLTRDDGSTHNFGLVARQGPFTFGFYYYFNLEKADEVKDDFLRVTGIYEF